MSINLSALAAECELVARDHGWWENEERNIGELLMLVVTEIAEAFEELRNNHTLDEIYYVDEKPEGFLIEIADVIIRILDFVEHYGLTGQLERALSAKLIFNMSRPYRHGGKSS